MEIFDPRQLINWGNSSKESFLIMRPTRVMRGSRLILNTGPVFSFKVIRRSSCDSASTYMLRNFHIMKRSPFLPIRSCLKITGPFGSSILMAMAMRA